MCRWTNIILAVGLVASLSWPTVFLSPAVMPQSFESLREAQPKGFRHLMLPIDAAKHCLTGEETVARSESSDGRGGQPNLLSVLPGLGWDNLENQERGPTIDRERYTLCRLSSDGSLLIPDDADVEPIKNSQIELTSEVFDNFTNYTSLTANSMKTGLEAGSSYFKISGDFSYEKEQIRKEQSSIKGLTVRTQIRHRLYIIHQLIDSPLHPRFRNRLLDIAAHLERGNVTLPILEALPRAVGVENTKATEITLEKVEVRVDTLKEGLYAAYLADLLVRDFGTHSITVVHAGAVLARMETLDSKTGEMSALEKQNLSAKAAANFAKFFGVTGNYEHKYDDQEISGYRSLIKSSRLITFGGPTLRLSNISLHQWEQGLINNLVAVDRRGCPLNELITSRVLPELNELIIRGLAKTVEVAILRYYAANAVVGCLDPKSIFYDKDANIQADHCDSTDRHEDGLDSTTTLLLGGVFTRCKGDESLCTGLGLANPKTGDFSCEPGYIEIQLIPKQIGRCAEECNSSWIYGTNCQQHCSTTETFWCSLDPEQAMDMAPSSPDGRSEVTDDLGLLFGGLYSTDMINPVTQTQTCPPYFFPLPLFPGDPGNGGIAGSTGLHICVSADRELGGEYALPFGGFYACQAGNPLAILADISTRKSGSTEGQGNTREEQKPKTRMNKTPNMEDNDEKVKRTEIRFVEPWRNLYLSAEKRLKHVVGKQIKRNHSDITPWRRTMNPEDVSLLVNQEFWPKRCPPGYTSHLAVMLNACQVNYCVKANSLKSKPARSLKRPPFIRMDYMGPLHESGRMDLDFKNQLTLTDPHGLRLTQEAGEWVSVYQASATELETCNKGLYTARFLAGTFGLFTALVVIGLIGLFLFYRIRTRLQNIQER